MIETKWTDSPTFWVCIAFLVAIAGVLSGAWFTSSDLITYGDDTSNTGKLTAGQTLGLVLQTYLVPLGMALWIMAAPELVKQPMAPGFKLLELLLLVALFAAGSAYAWYRDAWHLLNCGVAFCIWEEVDDNEYTSYSKKAYLYIAAVLYVLACIYFFVLLLPATLQTAALVLRAGCSEESSEKLWNYDAVDSSSSEGRMENSPLLRNPAGLDAAAAAEAEGKDSKSAAAWASNFSVIQSNRRYRQRWCMCCALGVLFPLCFILATVLPDIWEYFSRQGIQELAQSPETDDSNEAGPVLSFAFGTARGATVYAKLWPDQLIYVWGLLLVAVTAVALLPGAGQPFPKVSAVLQSRPQWLQMGLSSAGWTVGMVLFLFVWLMFLAALFAYWYALHGYDYTAKKNMAISQRVARTLGQCAVACLGLTLLPNSRTSVWPLVFGSGWEANIAVHQIFGYAVLVLGVGHAIMWYVYYAQSGILSDWYTLNESSEWPTDFTVNLQTVAFGITLVCMGGLALNVVRRARFEWFYFSHVTAALGFIVATLWHAYDSWYYMLPALVLYLMDHARRFQHATRQVTVRQFAADPSTGVVTLSYVLDGGPPSLVGQFTEWTQAPWRMLFGGSSDDEDNESQSNTSGSRKGQPLRCEAGQYVFLKVPALTMTESHPFSISSAPGDAWTSHHIRPMPLSTSVLGGGGPTFTAQLADLARSMQAAGDAPSSLALSVEGPYGVSIDYGGRYDAVLFIGGGIGVTPVHAAFRSLQHLEAVHGENSIQDAHSGPKSSAESAIVPGSVRMVWAARTPALLNMFGATWLAPGTFFVQQPRSAPPQASESDNPQDQGSATDYSLKGGVPGFSCALWCSNPDGVERGHNSSGGSGGGGGGPAKAVGPFATPPGSSPLAWAQGRPDYRAEVASIAGHGSRALVYVCHVKAVVEQCAALASEFGVELHAETFEL